MSAEPISPAVLYAAKSTPDERESIPDQLRDGREFAEREGLTVEGEYSEQDVSAYKGDRGPQLAAAIEHASALQGSLVVQHSDRLARGAGDRAGAARHLAELYFVANRAGVVLRSVQDDTTFDSPILVAVMGERNMEDSRRKSAAVKAGHARRRKRGKFGGGPAPYGYMKIRAENDELVLVPDPIKAEIVRRIFTEYVGGQPQLTIARSLAADRVPTLRGGLWHQGTVANILRNPIYIGMLKDGDSSCEGVHQAVIDRETWERAVQLREAKARTHQRGRPVAGLHLFRKGFLRCGGCGGTMMPRTSRMRSGAIEESYRCYEHHRDPTICDLTPLPRVAIDGAVYAYFEQVGLDVEATREELRAGSERKLREARALLSGAESEEQAAIARLARVRRDYANGELTAAEWRDLKEDLEPEASAAGAEALRLREQLSGVEAGLCLAEVEDELLAKLAHIRAAVAGEIRDGDGVAAVRAVLMRLFQGFVVRTGPPQSAHVELIGRIWLEPILSPHAVAGYDEERRPVLGRKPLENAGNNYAGSFQP